MFSKVTTLSSKKKKDIFRMWFIKFCLKALVLSPNWGDASTGRKDRS